MDIPTFLSYRAVVVDVIVVVVVVVVDVDKFNSRPGVSCVHTYKACTYIDI